MKVVMTFTWSDEDRANLVEYNFLRYGTPKTHRLATRKEIRDYIHTAIENQDMHMSDVLTNQAS